MALLLPEIVGLMVTPGAVIGRVLLLRSRDPMRNASTFGLGFLVVYSVVVLGVLNPNLFIMMSGMSVIASSAVGLEAALLATVILLVAAVVDFLIPIGIYLAMGERAEHGLAVAQAWMLRHSRVLTLSVLLGFGALFTARGIVNLAGLT
ncbi:GAP family protein [Nocardia sp. NPDC060249]|uniref:GAP family protein n=1 Tax=Nocardia sp. NPDC060249 TaxID=3347082 RepID=UPI00365FEB3C